MTETKMKLQLLVIGCCVALAVSKPAKDACAAMRARLSPALEPSARADAGALRTCDADSDGAVDAAELVSCVQRAFGSTAHMDRAEIGERIHCFRSIMTDTSLRGEQRQMIDSEEVRQITPSSNSISGLDCGGQNLLSQILVAIVDGKLRAAYDALIDLFISILSQPTGLLNGLLNSVSLTLQSLLSGKLAESLVYMLTVFVRSANNTLTAPVEDTLISSVLAVSVGNFAAARIVIKVHLSVEVLNPATQDELQWIIGAFDAGSTEDAVTRIISLLTGCTTSGVQWIYTQLMAVYDLIPVNLESEMNAFDAFRERMLERQPPLSDEDIEFFNNVAYLYDYGKEFKATVQILEFLTRPCDFHSDFLEHLIDFLNLFESSYFGYLPDELTGIIQNPVYANDPTYEAALSQLQAALVKVNNLKYDGALKEIRKIVVTCISKADMMNV